MTAKLNERWTIVNSGAIDEQLGSEPAYRVDGQSYIFEAEPAAGQRIPSLIDGFLRAEQQPIPVRRRKCARQRSYHLALSLDGDRFLDAIGQPAVLFGIDTDARKHALGSDC